MNSGIGQHISAEGDGEVPGWDFLTHHAHVLLCVSDDADIRLRDIAAAVGITERSTHKILTELVEDDYVLRERQGRRNRYTVKPEMPLRHPLVRERTVADLLGALTKPKTEGIDTVSSEESHVWRESVAPHELPSMRRSLVDLATSVVPYLALTVLMYLCLDVSVWITLALAIPAAGFLLRTFIVFHDCTHGSFMPTKRGNRWVGRFAGLLVFQPFANWGHNHAVHHGTAGDLDRRGTGDVMTLTVEEYESRALERAARVPALPQPAGDVRDRADLVADDRPSDLVLQAAHPPAKQHPADQPCAGDRRRRDRLARRLQAWLLVQMPVVDPRRHRWASGCSTSSTSSRTPTGRARENWSYSDAALQGSSYLRLPKVLQFFTGNIGLHHVHHLSAKIPNYNLQRAHDEIEIFQEVPVLTIRDGLRSIRLKLIDPDSGRLLTWGEVRSLA